LPSGFLQTRSRPQNPCLRLTIPLAGLVEDFHLQVGAPCRAHAKKTPADEPGLESLFAVITSRLLLREEKQGTTTLRLSSGNDVIRAAAAASLRNVA
jgi:hypothetical protein